MMSYLIIILLLLLFVIVLFLIKYRYFVKLLITNYRQNLKLKKLKVKKNKKDDQQKTNIDILLKHLGDKNNIKEVKLYSMRLKIIVKDKNLIDKKGLQSNSLLSGVIINGNICQLIVGKHSKQVYKFLARQE